MKTDDVKVILKMLDKHGNVEIKGDLTYIMDFTNDLTHDSSASWDVPAGMDVLVLMWNEDKRSRTVYIDTACITSIMVIK